MTRDEAIRLGKSGWWRTRTPEDIVRIQLFTSMLIMDFDAFHRAVEKVLNRPVFVHEFGDVDRLRAEFLGEKPAPTVEEILALLPRKGNVTVVVVEDKMKEDC